MALIRMAVVWGKQNPSYCWCKFSRSKLENRKGKPLCLFAVAANTEGGTKPSQVSAHASLGLRALSAGGLFASTCVCDMACVHRSWTTELAEASHVQRLLQNGDPNPRNFWGLLRTFPELSVSCLP